ncbi:hypothetical protein JXB02_06495 [Candidatus Woesearchaeota archaeon]|nr:hypothetical protein [Candidatus Woesearchaeota archaeon]
MSKKAVIGTGILIIFLALLLVAAIVGGVILTMSSSVQESTLRTGRDAQQEVGTHVRVVEIVGRGQGTGEIDDLQAMVKLESGSQAVGLSSTLITETTVNTTNVLHLKENAACKRDVFLGYFSARGTPQELKTDPFPDPVDVWPFSSYQTSAMLLGKVAIAIVFLESNGTVDPNYENWTNGEQDYIVADTLEAMNWYARLEPRAGLQYTFDIYEVETSYEPVTRNNSQANQSLWISEALDQIGAPSGPSLFARERDFLNILRMRMNAHWAFIMYVVDSSETVGQFDGGPPGYAYLNGPHTVIASDGYPGAMPALIAHEFGHIFGANDEYESSGCACTDTAGYFNIETQNCDSPPAGCFTNISSLMRGGIIGYYTDALDYFARAQMGLIDTNGNDILDPVDILFESPSGVNVSQTRINLLSNTQYEYTVSADRIGFFSAEFERSVDNPVDNVLQRGDFMKVCHELGRPVGEDEEIRLNIVPKVGTTTITEFLTPQVIAREREYVYPVK